MVSGGPYCLEEIIQKAGYSRAILILAIVPIIWSLPVALMVGELSAALPEEGGYYAWVRRALGPFWGFQEAWLSLAASIFDMAIYPTSAGDVSNEITYDTDHGPFMVAGIPALDLEVDMKAYMEIHHTAGDTVDKIKPENLNTGAAVLTLTAYDIAQAEKPIAAHLDRNAVGNILKEKDLDQFLKSVGAW
jgi:amino acid transporter